MQQFKFIENNLQNFDVHTNHQHHLWQGRGKLFRNLNCMPYSTRVCMKLNLNSYINLQNAEINKCN